MFSQDVALGLEEPFTTNPLTTSLSNGGLVLNGSREGCTTRPPPVRQIVIPFPKSPRLNLGDFGTSVCLGPFPPCAMSMTTQSTAPWGASLVLTVAIPDNTPVSSGKVLFPGSVRGHRRPLPQPFTSRVHSEDCVCLKLKPIVRVGFCETRRPDP